MQHCNPSMRDEYVFLFFFFATLNDPCDVVQFTDTVFHYFMYQIETIDIDDSLLTAAP